VSRSASENPDGLESTVRACIANLAAAHRFGPKIRAQRTKLILRCNAPRVPKVTVTRKGDSLCQKGCYPMARVFLVSCSLAQ